MSLLRPALRPALNPIRRAINGIDSITRFFTQFDEIAKSYVNIGSVVTLDNSSPWVLEFDCVPTESSTSNGFRVSNSSTGDFIKFFDSNDASNPNLIRVSQNGGTADFGNALLGMDRAKLNRFAIINDGLGALMLYINGALVGTKGAFTSFTLDSIGLGTEFGGDAADVIANIKIWTGGDKTTGTLVFDMPIDQEYTPTNNTVIDKAGGNNGTFVNVADGDSEAYTLEGGDWVGENLFTQAVWENPHAVDNTAWTYDSGGNTWSLDGDGSYQALQPIISTGYRYPAIIEGRVTALSGNIQVADSGANAVVEAAGEYRITLTDANGSQLFKRILGVATATLEKPSFRQLIEVAY